MGLGLGAACALLLTSACFFDLDAEGGTGSCSISAECHPVGLTMHFVWLEGQPWPADLVNVQLGHPDLQSGFICEGDGENFTCTLSCPGGELVDQPAVYPDLPAQTCRLPLPLGVDEEGDPHLEHELEYWLETRADGPTLRAVEYERTERYIRELWPRDFELTVDGPGGTFFWEFLPPNIHLEASAVGTVECPAEVCDGHIQLLEVEKLPYPE
jgi:hypothetical protein